MKTPEVTKPNHTLLKYGNKKLVFYIAINDDTGELWIDITHMPATCMLCAISDGMSILSMSVGKGRGKHRRTFLPLKWVAYDWCDENEITKALQEKYESISKNWKSIVEEDINTILKY